MWNLGTVTFEGLNGFTAFSSAAQANYVQHQTLDSRPRLQRIGTQLESISVELAFHSRFCVPEQEIAKMYFALESAIAEPLTNGSGVYMGRYVVEAFDYEIMQTDKRGRILHATASAQLLESVALGEVPADRSTAFGMVGRGAPGQFFRPVTTAYTDAGRVSRELTTISTSSQAIDNQITAAASDPAIVENNFRRSRNQLTDAQAALSRVNTLVNNTQSTIYDAALGIRTQLSIVQGAASVLDTALATPDVVAASAANIGFKNAVRDMRRLSARVLALQAIRVL